MSEHFKSGFVGIVGPTNAGKSTLLNSMVGEKLSIVSPLPQTTYHGIRGILHGEGYQLVITDTPGFQKHPDRVPQLLNKVADRNAEESDALVWVFDVASPRVMDQVEKLAPKIKKLKPASHSFCVLNKVDKIDKPLLLPMLEKLYAMELFKEVIPMSARNGKAVPALVKALVDCLPEGPAMYADDQTTDRPRDFRISEIIREKIYKSTRQEIPYSVYIELEESGEEAPEESPEASHKKRVPTIRAVIHVDSESRKPILIGKKGELLKQIGIHARKEIETMMGRQICLKLHVDVDPAWKDNANRLNRYLELS